MATIEYRYTENGKNPWRVQIRKKGFQYVQKSFSTEKEAKLWADEIESGISNSKKQFELPKLLLAVWIDRWMSEEGPTRKYFTAEKKYLDFWKQRLGKEIAIDISSSLIEDTADQILKTRSRLGKFLSLETRRKYLLYLSSLYTTAMKKWKWCTLNPLTCVDMLRKEEFKEEKVPERLDFLNEFKRNFIILVAKIMKEQNLSQRDAAKRCFLSLHAFQNAINQKDNPTIKTMMKICNGLGMKINIEGNL